MTTNNRPTVSEAVRSVLATAWLLGFLYVYVYFNPVPLTDVY